LDSDRCLLIFFFIYTLATHNKRSRGGVGSFANAERAQLAKRAVETAERAAKIAAKREAREFAKLAPHDHIDAQRQARALQRFQEVCEIVIRWNDFMDAVICA
jgi:hypothetical protein